VCSNVNKACQAIKTQSASLIPASAHGSIRYAIGRASN
ncbi:hypothetical protein CCACVL1_01745, partial [Corchorus capsularis]